MGRIKIMQDAHQPGRSIGARPLLQPHGWMKDVLHPVNYQRPAGIVLKRDNAFNAQKVPAMNLAHHFDEQFEICRVQGIPGTQAAGPDMRIVTVWVVRMARFMAVSVMRMIMALCMSLDGLGLQPSADIS